MKTHKYVGEPVSELVVRMELQPIREHGPFMRYWDYRENDWHWCNVLDFAKHHAETSSPYQPGDMVQFWPMCEMCDRAASWIFSRYPRCFEHEYEHLKVIKAQPESLAVSRIELQEKDKEYNWIVHLRKLDES